MKNIYLAIIFFSFVSCDVISPQSFSPNQEINFSKIEKFNPNKIKFKDYKKIIGNKDIESWDGNPKTKGKNIKDWKAIKVKIAGKDANLRFNKRNDDTTSLAIFIKNSKCSDYDSIIPKKYIKEENLKDYVSDFSFVKVRNIEFSYDFQNSRMSFDCIGMPYGKTEKSKKGGLMALAVTKKSDTKKILAFKEIECIITKYKPLNSRNDYNAKFKFLYEHNKVKSLSNSQTVFYYIDETKKTLRNEKYWTLGNYEKFNENKIVVKEQSKIKDKTKNKQIFVRYEIDRRNGDLKIIRERYLAKNKYLKKKILKAAYFGKCNKRLGSRKF